jgi:hypothetical protein
MKDKNRTVIAPALLTLAHLVALHLVQADQLTMLTDFGLPKSASPSQFVSVNGMLFFVAGVEYLTLPPGQTSLTELDVDDNDMTSLTLSAGLTNLTTLLLGDNPLKTFVLPEPLAVTRLADTVASLTSQGVAGRTGRQFWQRGRNGERRAV